MPTIVTSAPMPATATPRSIVDWMPTTSSTSVAPSGPMIWRIAAAASASGPHDGVGADRRGVLQLALVEVDGHDAHPGEHLEQLDRHVPEAAGADDHGPPARTDLAAASA